MVFNPVNIQEGEFNSGLAIVFRVDSIRKNLHIAKFTQDTERYYSGLVALFMELCRFCKKDSPEQKAHLAQWTKVRKDYFDIRDCLAKNKGVDALLYESFYKWEMELTYLEDKFIGMPRKDLAKLALQQ